MKNLYTQPACAAPADLAAPDADRVRLAILDKTLRNPTVHDYTHDLINSMSGATGFSNILRSLIVSGDIAREANEPIDHRALYLARLIREMGGAFPAISVNELGDNPREINRILDKIKHDASITTAEGKAIELTEEKLTELIDALGASLTGNELTMIDDAPDDPNKGSLKDPLFSHGVAPVATPDKLKTDKSHLNTAPELVLEQVLGNDINPTSWRMSAPDRVHLVGALANQMHCISCPKLAPPSLKRWAHRIESAFNRLTLALHYSKGSAHTEAELALWDHAILQAGASPLYDITTAEQDRDDLSVRKMIALLLTKLSTPYRLSPQFRLNMKAGICIIEFKAPELEMMPKTRYDTAQNCWVAMTPLEQRALHTRYLAALGINLASMAFWATQSLQEVIIQCIPETANREGEILYRAEFDRESFLECAALAATDPVSALLSQRTTAGIDRQMFLPITMALNINDKRFTYCWFQAIENLNTTLDQMSQITMKATVSGDLAILPDQTVVPTQGEITALVHQLIEDGIPVPEMISTLNKTILAYPGTDAALFCAWICRALADHESNVDSRSLTEIITELSMDTVSIVGQASAARMLAGNDRTDEAIDLVRQTINDVLPPEVWQDETKVIRAFKTPVERVIYNHHFEHDIRNLALIPAATLHLILLLSEILSEERAFNEAQEIARIACLINPFYDLSYLHLVRAHELNKDYGAAVEVCLEALRNTLTSADLGRLLYRLGFLSYQYARKLGKITDDNLVTKSLACYEVALTLPIGSLYDDALKEYEELCEQHGVTPHSRSLKESQDTLESYLIPARIHPNTTCFVESALEAASNAGLLSVAESCAEWLAEENPDRDDLALVAQSYPTKDVL